LVLGAGRPSHAHPWVTAARTFGRPDARRSMLQLLTTAVPLAAIWAAMKLNQDYGVGYWATLLLAIPAAGLLVRLFMIQHDCGHGSFFHARWLNDLVGRVIGVFTLTPYDHWRSAHAHHHATSGNLSRRGIGDIDVLTVEEYLALSSWSRFLYRFYRNPFVFFGFGPIYVFVIKHRFPFRSRPEGKREIASVLATNVAIVAVVACAMYVFGAADLLLVQIPITLLASSIGVWLFFVQHQFAHTYWEPQASWSFQDAALRGSSYYDLPRILRWFTADIGIHHVHHLCSKIPNYRLRECVDANPELAAVEKLTLWESLKCMRLALWSEQQKRLVGFRDLKALAQGS
jgi:acyl-lipid omega-6 desaturase (Delta-12 desaturase)